MTEFDTVNEPNQPASGGAAEERDPVPGVVDWVIGIVTGVIGLALVAVGAGLYTKLDRSTIADIVAAEEVQVNGLTPTEFVTAAGPFVDWLAIGVAVTGFALVVGSAVFVRARRRTRRRVAREGGTTATFWASAVYGAVITALVSFVPGAATVGGATAAYLYGSEESVRVGATAGLVGWAVTIPLLAFLSVGLLAGTGAIGELAVGALLVGLGIGAELIGLVFSAGLGALGGFLMARFS